MSSGGISNNQTGWDQSESVQKTAMLLWDTGSLSWIKATGGATGGNVTVSNFPSSFGATQVGAWDITNVTGTVSLPTGAATATKQDTGNTSLASIDGKITAVNTGAVVISSGVITSITNPVAVTGTFYQATQPVSGTVTGQAVATVAAPAYTEGTASNLSQTLTGDLRIQARGLVDDATASYVIGEAQPLSMTTEGRLRVSTANESYNLSAWGDPEKFTSNYNQRITTAW